MIRDVIVSLGLGAKDPAGDYAASFAAAFEAHLTGVAFVFDPIVPATVMGGIPPELIESQRRNNEAKAKAAIERFGNAARSAGVPVQTVSQNTGAAEGANQLAAMARRFDLSICAQPDPNGATMDDLLGESLLFGSGRPMLMVPYIHTAGFKADRVMVCWDGGRSAARAIGDAIPLLTKAKTVDIVMVTKGGEDKSGEIAGADLGQHLARHGITVDVSRVPGGSSDVTGTILSYAADSNADMIVMGAYGHSRLREFILGGVTRGILSSMTVPVLMSH